MAFDKKDRGVATFFMLCCSTVFMTCAWYYHLKKENWPIAKAIAVSWLIAGVEYLIMIPANRIGHESNGGPFTAPKLKVLSEGISLTVFALFSTYVLREKLRWTDFIAFVLVYAGVVVSMAGKELLGDGRGHSVPTSLTADNETESLLNASTVEMQDIPSPRGR